MTRAQISLTRVVSYLARSDTPNITLVVTPRCKVQSAHTTTVSYISSFHAYSYLGHSTRIDWLCPPLI